MKKNLLVNCEVCDTRTMKEENYSNYEQIVVNAEMLIISERSKDILNRLPAVTNVENTIELEDDVQVNLVNGDYEISENSPVEEKTFLSVNGRLIIHKNTEEKVKSFSKIFVNGELKIPESMAAYISGIQVNGKVKRIPDDCKELEDAFVVDKYFPMRARENARYYVEDRVKILNPNVDVKMLSDKQVCFVTKEVVAPEEMIPIILGMFDERVKIKEIPTGYSYVEADAVLNSALLEKHGNKLYVDGDFYFKSESEPFIEKLEKLYVDGTVYLPKSQLEAFKNVETTYRELVIAKGRKIKNTSKYIVDKKMLELAEDGLSIKNCAKIEIDEDVTPELILEKLEIKNCAKVYCTREQRSSLQLVSKNVGSFRDRTEEKEDDGGGLGMIKQMMESKLINAESYQL